MVLYIHGGEVARPESTASMINDYAKRLKARDLRRKRKTTALCILAVIVGAIAFLVSGLQPHI